MVDRKETVTLRHRLGDYCKTHAEVEAKKGASTEMAELGSLKSVTLEACTAIDRAQRKRG